MSKDKTEKKDCTDCIYFDMESFYGVCNKHCEILNDEKICKDFEEELNERN